MPEIVPKLIRKDGKVVACTADGEEVAVRLVWARPVSGRGKEVSLLDEKGKEIALLASVSVLEPPSRVVADEALAARYLIPKITRVLRATAVFGRRIVEVETDRGRRAFAMKSPHRSVIWPTDDRLMIRDAVGNRYEVESFSRLDPASREEIEKVL